MRSPGPLSVIVGQTRILIEMDRRMFIARACTFLGGSLAVEAQAQQVRRHWRIGILSPYAVDGPWSKEVAQTLRDAGYVDGHNGRIEWRSSGGQSGHFPALAGDLVKIQVDAILAV